MTSLAPLLHLFSNMMNIKKLSAEITFHSTMVDLAENGADLRRACGLPHADLEARAERAALESLRLQRMRTALYRGFGAFGA